MSAVQKFFRPGQFLFREGDPSRSMFLIKKGTVAIRKRKATAYVEIARIYSNEVLGELSFFDRLPRSAAAVALTEVEVLEIEFSSLDKVYTTVPDYLKTIIASVADRLRKANDIIRRLQKNVVADNEIGADGKPGQDASASDVLAATEGVTGKEAKDSAADGEAGGEESAPKPGAGPDAGNAKAGLEGLAELDAAKSESQKKP